MSSGPVIYGNPAKFRLALRRRLDAADDLLRHVGDAQQAALAQTPGERSSLTSELKALHIVGPPMDTFHKWLRTNSQVVRRYLGPRADDWYGSAPAPRLPHPPGVSDMDGVAETIRIRAAELKEIERRVPVRQAVGARPVEIYALDELRASGWFDSEAIDSFERRLANLSSRQQWRPAIAAAKELVEALHKAVLLELGHPAPAKGLDFPRLAKLARRAMIDALGEQGSQAAHVDANLDLARSLESLMHALANARNEHGEGHGRPRALPGLALRHVELMVESAVVYSRYVLATMNDLGRLHRS